MYYFPICINLKIKGYPTSRIDCFSIVLYNMVDDNEKVLSFLEQNMTYENSVIEQIT